jgi:putative ABC transport system permease protein
VLILVIACINFMNLATARSTTRAREVGLRKVVGSSRSLLISQFIAESIFLSLFALVIAVIIVYLLLPAYNNLIRMDLVFDIFSSGRIIPLLILLAVFVGILAGTYPAFVLASFRPTAVLKAEMKTGSRKSFLRSLLIVLQFTVSIVILLGTLTVNRQLNFMQKKDPGFGKERVLVVHRSDALQESIDAFKQDISQHANILSVANCTHIPSGNYWNNAHWLEGWDRSNVITIWTCYSSYDYDNAMDLEILQGRFFDRNMPTDSFAVIVNQATLKSLAIEDPLNTRFEEPNDEGGVERYYPIIGVVKDFHFQSMHEEIQPMAIHFMRGNWEGVLTIKLGGGSMPATVDFVRQAWEEFNTGYPFEYSWLDDEFGKLFETERRTSKILLVFSILSIFISCLGLLGLISYSTNQRTKEIGIRKTMGASVNIVMLLLSRETVRLLGIATAISIPAYFGIRAWLQNFAYHISFNPAIFLLALALVAIIVLIIALLTVSYTSYRAATANPAQSLRVE